MARRPLKNTCGERHLTDPVIRRIQERSGTIGVIPYNRFLEPEWTLHVKTGNSNPSAFGIPDRYFLPTGRRFLSYRHRSDLDGGFGFPNIPVEMDTISEPAKNWNPFYKKKDILHKILAISLGLNWKKTPGVDLAGMTKPKEIHNQEAVQLEMEIGIPLPASTPGSGFDLP